MKKIFLIGFSIAILAACGGGNDSKTEETKTADITKDPDYQDGLALEIKNDCKTCHSIDTKITGPSFREIADKYANAPDTIVSHLANKVISGGSGVWGAIPMLPHANMSKADAEAIVKYILLLKSPGK
jgi:cytochrome c